MTHLNQPEENEGRIRKILFNEVALFLGLAGTLLSAVFWISGPQQQLKLELTRLQARQEATEALSNQLANIKDNDLHELQRKMDALTEQNIEIQKAIVRLETKISK